jgi:hypothetical protein
MAQAKAGGALNDLNTKIVASLDDFQDPSQEWRRLFSELLGTFFLVLVAAGGGMMGQAFPNTISRAAADTKYSCTNAMPPYGPSRPRQPQASAPAIEGTAATPSFAGAPRLLLRVLPPRQGQSGAAVHDPEVGPTGKFD